MEHKRGSTFDYFVNIPSTFGEGEFVGWAVTAQIRSRPAGTLIADLEPEWANPVTTRRLNLKKIDTTTWVLGNAEFDIKFERASDGYTLTTNTVPIVIVKDVTL